MGLSIRRNKITDTIISPTQSFKKYSQHSHLYEKKKFKNFDEMLSSYTEPVLVDFYAVWCGPCQLMSSELSSLSTKLQGTLKVAKVDTDVYPQLGERYQIDGLPTCVLFKGGKEVKRLVGVMKTDEIEGHIKEFL